MLNDFQPGFPELNAPPARPGVRTARRERAEDAKRRQRAENILNAIRMRRETERAQKRG